MDGDHASPCVPCPVDTYKDNVGDDGGDCTSCPVNHATYGRTGETSEEDCGK